MIKKIFTRASLLLFFSLLWITFVSAAWQQYCVLTIPWAVWVSDYTLEGTWDGPDWTGCVLWNGIDATDRNAPLNEQVSMLTWTWGTVITSTSTRDNYFRLIWIDDFWITTTPNNWITTYNVKESTSTACLDSIWNNVTQTFTPVYQTQDLIGLLDLNKMDIPFTISSWVWTKYICSRLADQAWNWSSWLWTSVTYTTDLIATSITPAIWYNTDAANITPSNVQGRNFVNWRTYSITLAKNWVWAPTVALTWVASSTTQIDISTAYNFQSVYTTLWWGTTNLSIDVAVTDPIAVKTSTITNGMFIYALSGVVATNYSTAFRMQYSKSIFQKLYTSGVLGEIPKINWCEPLTPIIKMSPDASCFQIGVVLKNGNSIQAKITWNCIIDWTWATNDTLVARGPLWILDWETNKQLIEERLYNPITCSLQKLQATGYNSAGTTWVAGP